MVHLIRQHDERDCGAACLAMIARYHGLYLPLARFREMTKTDGQGASLYGLSVAAEQIGLQADALQGSPDEFLAAVRKKEISLPCIAHTIIDGYEHYIVVTRVTTRSVYAVDPARGRVRYSISTLASIWTGYVLALEKTDRFSRKREVSPTPIRFLRLLRGQYKMALCVFLAALMMTVAGMASALSIQIIIDKTLGATEESEHDHEHEEVAGDDGSSWLERVDGAIEAVAENATASLGAHITNISAICIVVILICVIQGLCRYLREFLLARISRNLGKKLMLESYERLLCLPMSFTHSVKTGDIISRFSDIAMIRDAISSIMLTIVLDSLLAIGCGIFLFHISPALFLVAVATALFDLIVMLCYLMPINRVNHTIMSDEAKVMTQIKESVSGMESIKAAHAEEAVYRTGRAKFTSLIHREYRGTLLYASKLSISDLFNTVSIVVVFWVGSLLIAAGHLSVGSLISFYMIMSYFTDPIQRLMDVQQTIQSAGVALSRLEDISDATPEQMAYDSETKEPSGTASPAEHPMGIQCRSVTFRYGTREPVLQDVSLNISQGSQVAIVGESGSGKTTLARLLLRFYEPESGIISLDGVPIDEISPDSLRKKIAYLPQDPVFFSETIRYNLDPCAIHNDERLMEVCRDCQIDGYIRSLSSGLDSVVDEGGRNLSSGQKQRLALVRALLQEPTVLILDEATCNLDGKTEEVIRTMLHNRLPNTTVIIIAHRLSTIRSCDYIYVMQDGHIMEEGTHTQLLSRNGIYAVQLHHQ